jgi:alkylhydroperoxidase family enzyme
MTRAPASLRRRDVEILRKHRLSDRDILDAVQVISYFNYINRVADALGIEPEAEMEEAFRHWRKERRRGGKKRD